MRTLAIVAGTVQPRPGEAAPAESAEQPAAQPAEQPTAQPETWTPPSTDVPMVPLTAAGTAAWAIAAVVMLPFRDGHESWFWICVAGFLWGIPGLLVMLRREANRRR